ncbi:hypothetical protein ES705_36533 [subsurface metagenome]
MSLFTQIGTCIGGRRRSRLRICPQINVLFTLDSTSLLTIIDGMKGLNCYACFLSYPGLEKLLNFIEAKAKFLRPVTPSYAQRDLYFQRAVIGMPPFLRYVVLRALPATVFLCLAHFSSGGRQKSIPPIQGAFALAGHRYFQSSTYLTGRLCRSSFLMSCDNRRHRKRYTDRPTA